MKLNCVLMSKKLEKHLKWSFKYNIFLGMSVHALSMLWSTSTKVLNLGLQVLLPIGGNGEVNFKTFLIHFLRVCLCIDYFSQKNAATDEQVENLFIWERLKAVRNFVWHDKQVSLFNAHLLQFYYWHQWVVPQSTAL